MTGCYTCGGGMGKHDPVAHDQVVEDDEQCGYVFPSLARCQRVVGHRGECNPVPWKHIDPPLPDRGFFTYDEHGRRVTE